MLTKKFSLVEHDIPPSPCEVKAFIASEAMSCPQILGMNTKIKNKKQPMNSNNNNRKKKKTEKTQKLIVSPNKHYKSHIRDHGLEVPGVLMDKRTGAF